MNLIEGGCFCGAVRYRIAGRPENSMVCHCRSCRRVAAAPVVAWLTFAREHVTFTAGQPVEFKSSDPVTRSFCGRCGTSLTYTHADSPRTLDVTTCSLDDAQAFPPTHHSWLKDDLAWVRFGDGLPTWPEWRRDEPA